jgi:hypothetical protein
MSKIIVHEDWDRSTLKNDFAIVVLEKATTMDITFPKLNADDLYPVDGEISRVIGWGRTGTWDSQPTKLLEVDIPIISNEDCDECLGGNDFISDSMICAYQTGGGVSHCSGKCSLFMTCCLSLLNLHMTLSYFITRSANLCAGDSGKCIRYVLTQHYLIRHLSKRMS